MKTLNYLYKVCSGTNASRSFHSRSSFKALPFDKEISTFSSAITNVISDFRNPNEFPGTGSEYDKDWSFRGSKSEYDQNYFGVDDENPMGIQRNLSGAYGLRKSKREFFFHQESNYNVLGTFSGVLNPQVSGYHLLNEKSEETVEGKKLFGTIEELDAFSKCGKLKEAVKVLGLLEKNNVSVDIPRYLFLMKACGDSQALREAEHVHDHLTRSVPHLDVYICNKILEMYSKCGSMVNAYNVFDKMPQRNLTSWDTMITWLAKNGHGEDAVEMFSEFKRVGLKPDNQMFLGVFTACSVLGDIREGLLHFESMIKTYNLVPSMDLYASVVDMLGSAGYLNEALEFVEKMTMEPSVDIWEIMMNQSRVHGELELGDRFAEIVNLLHPSRLDEQSKEGLIPIKPSDIAKDKGPNLVDITYKYNTESMSIEPDTSHPNYYKLYSQLRCLKQTMKEVGYVPETRFALHDVDQESREDVLLSHGARLVLSQALFTSPARATIRICRAELLCTNDHICGDCHNALKIISKVVGRSIIQREERRFHYFENGVCSCRDYW